MVITMNANFNWSLYLKIKTVSKKEIFLFKNNHKMFLKKYLSYFLQASAKKCVIQYLEFKKVLKYNIFNEFPISIENFTPHVLKF